MLPYPVLEYGDYGKRKTICCLHLRRKGLHGNGLGLMEKGWPLTHCVYFDTGMEFSCIRKNIEKVRTGIGAVWVRTCYSTAGKAFPGRNAPSTDQVPGRIIALWKLLVRWAMPLDDTP